MENIQDAKTATQFENQNSLENRVIVKNSTRSKSAANIILVLLLMSASGVVGFMYNEYNISDKIHKFSNSNPTPSPYPSSSPSDTLSPKQLIKSGVYPEYTVTKYPNENVLWYKVSLRQQSTSQMKTADKLLSDALLELFNLPFIDMGSRGISPPIEKIIWDTSLGDPYYNESLENRELERYNHDYYISIKGFTLDKTTYENEDFRVNVEPANQSLIPYLNNSDYCQKNSDCSMRSSFCGKGSLNNYEVYGDGWGCGPELQDLENEDAFGNKVYDNTYDSQNSCIRIAEYDTVYCENNQCKASGREIICMPL